MKFKYYLRGAGIGIIVTTLIFTIALLRYEPTLSANEIREKAAKLGMVMPEETASGDAQKENKQEEELQKTEEQQEEGVKEVSTVRFVIKGGQFSDVVSNNLAEKGLVPDGEEYNDWLMDHHYDSKIQPGVYYIKSDATYKEIAEMITEKQE